MLIDGTPADHQSLWVALAAHLTILYTTQVAYRC